MPKPDWAMRKINRLFTRERIVRGDIARLLRTEHKRSVRVVQQIAKNDSWCQEVCEAVVKALRKER